MKNKNRIKNSNSVLKVTDIIDGQIKYFWFRSGVMEFTKCKFSTLSKHLKNGTVMYGRWVIERCQKPNDVCVLE